MPIALSNLLHPLNGASVADAPSRVSTKCAAGSSALTSAMSLWDSVSSSPHSPAAVHENGAMANIMSMAIDETNILSLGTRLQSRPLYRVSSNTSPFPCYVCSAIPRTKPTARFRFSSRRRVLRSLEPNFA
ncbi:MAG TPA: hypothetical protein VII20_10975 [Roseiarcus sp.]